MNRLASIDSEQAVLGAIMQTGGKSLMDVQDIIGREDFLRADHKIIWDAMVALDELDSPSDFVTLTERLENHHLLNLLNHQDYQD